MSALERLDHVDRGGEVGPVAGFDGGLAERTGVGVRAKPWEAANKGGRGQDDGMSELSAPSASMVVQLRIGL